MCWNRRRCLLYLRRRLHVLRVRDRVRLAYAAMALVLAAGLFYMFYTQLQPALQSTVSSQAANLIARTISATVDDCLADYDLKYGDFISVQTDWTGNVSSLTENTAASSQFKRQVIDAVTERVKGLDCDELSVPLGNLTGQALLSGHGPSVQVAVYSVECVTADYANIFTAAGENQTLHTLHLNVTAQVRLRSLGNVFPVTINSTTRVAETITIGNMPGVY